MYRIAYSSELLERKKELPLHDQFISSLGADMRIYHRNSSVDIDEGTSSTYMIQ
jgi:hypothetical protein